MTDYERGVWLDAVAQRDAACEIETEEGDFQYTNIAGRDRRHLLRLVGQLQAALLDVRQSGVEQDDTRLRYVTIQVDRETWEEARTALAACDAATPPEGKA